VVVVVDVVERGVVTGSAGAGGRASVVAALARREARALYRRGRRRCRCCAQTG